MRLIGSKDSAPGPLRLQFSSKNLVVLYEKIRIKFCFFVNGNKTRFLEIKKEEKPIDALNFRKFQLWQVKDYLFWAEARSSPRAQIDFSYFIPNDRILETPSLSLDAEQVDLMLPLRNSGNLIILADRSKLLTVSLLENEGELQKKSVEIICLDSWEIKDKSICGVWESADCECLFLETMTKELMIANYTRSQVLKTFALEERVRSVLDVIHSKSNVEVFVMRPAAKSFEKLRLEKKDVSRIYNKYNLRNQKKEKKIKQEQDKRSGNQLLNEKKQLETQQE